MPHNARPTDRERMSPNAESASMLSLRESLNPAACDFGEAPAVELVDTFAPLQLHTHEPGVLKDSKVSRCRRPGAVEPRRDRARRHLPAAGFQNAEDRAPRSMSERGEHGIKFLEVLNTLGLGWSHALRVIR